MLDAELPGLLEPNTPEPVDESQIALAFEDVDTGDDAGNREDFGQYLITSLQELIDKSVPIQDQPALGEWRERCGQLWRNGQQFLQRQWQCLQELQMVLEQHQHQQQMMQELAQQCAQLRGSEEKLTKEKQELVEQYQELRTDYQATVKQLNSAQTKLATIEAELEIRLTQNGNWQPEQNVSAEVRRLTQENQILQTKNKILTREKENLVDEKDVLRQQLEVITEEKERLLQKTLEQTKALGNFEQQREKVQIFQEKLQSFTQSLQEEFAVIRQLLREQRGM